MKMSLLIKITMMVMALYGIIAMMDWLKTPSEPNKDSAIALLLGTDAKPYNWCGAPTTEVHLRSKNPVISATKTLNVQERVRICEVLIEPVGADEVKGEFIVVAQALEPEGPVDLEVNDSGIYRARGLPFRSKALTKALSELQQ